MARNHVNYAIGKFSIEPMASFGIEKTCTTFTGKLCEVKEKVTYKKSRFYHWLSLGFDADSMGPTKRIFFNVLKDKEIIWLFQMAKDSIILQEGDEVTIEYAGKSITVIVNGEEVPQVKASRTSAIYKELYRCRRNDSIDDVLRGVCPWALPADVRDETVGEEVYRCRELLSNMLVDASEYELRLLIAKLFFPDALLFTFKVILEELRKILSENSLAEILRSDTDDCRPLDDEVCPDDENRGNLTIDQEEDTLNLGAAMAAVLTAKIEKKSRRKVKKVKKVKKGEGRKDQGTVCSQSHDEFAINDFTN